MILNDPDDFRFERKFIISGFSMEQIKAQVKLHKSMFRELFPLRFVNNVYYDTFDLRNYFANVDGQSSRSKVRIRWYGDLFGNSRRGKIEIKVKKGLLGTKLLFDISPFDFYTESTKKQLTEILHNAVVPDHIKEEFLLLSPSLINRYSRQYYISADGKFRLTLDDHLEYFRIKTFADQVTKSVDSSNKVILEVKYAFDSEKNINDITSQFPFRLTKSSKYVDGISTLWHKYLY